MILEFLLALCSIPGNVQAPAPAAPAAAPATAARDLASLLEPIRAKNDVPALCAAVLRGGELVARGATGVRKRGAEEKVTVDDRFHLGSCTKAMTATLAAVLVEEGKLRWDTKLFEVFPELAAQSEPGWQDETLAALLLNRGGLPAQLDEGGLWQRLWDAKGEPEAQRRMLLEGVLHFPPLSPPGTTFLYSNANFAVAGAMLEKAAQKPWEDLMVEKLFRPLGMDSAGYGPPGTASALDQPRGHNDKGEPVGLTGLADNPASISPAGRVHCSISDWAKFIALHVAGARSVRGLGEARAPLLVTKESFARMHASPDGPDKGYAMGWGVTQRPWGGIVLTHNGSNNLWYCSVWLSPEKDFAALVCTNQGGKAAQKACDATAAMLVHEFVDKQPGLVKVKPQEPGK